MQQRKFTMYLLRLRILYPFRSYPFSSLFCPCSCQTSWKLRSTSKIWGPSGNIVGIWLWTNTQIPKRTRLRRRASRKVTWWWTTATRLLDFNATPNRLPTDRDVHPVRTKGREGWRTCGSSFCLCSSLMESVSSRWIDWVSFEQWNWLGELLVASVSNSETDEPFYTMGFVDSTSG